MIYNLDKLQELSGGDEEFIVSVVEVFIEETPQDLLNLKNAIENKDFEGIYQNAHKIKPNVDLLGMEEVRQNAYDIEMQGRNDKNMEIITKLFPFVETTINDAIVELKKNFGL